MFPDLCFKSFAPAMMMRIRLWVGKTEPGVGRRYQMMVMETVQETDEFGQRGGRHARQVGGLGTHSE